MVYPNKHTTHLQASDDVSTIIITITFILNTFITVLLSVVLLLFLPKP